MSICFEESGAVEVWTRSVADSPQVRSRGRCVMGLFPVVTSDRISFALEIGNLDVYAMVFG